MPATRWPLREAVARLEQHYGIPAPLQVSDPFELVLWECCAYLVDDTRRARVYGRLVAATVPRDAGRRHHPTSRIPGKRSRPAGAIGGGLGASASS